MEDPVAVTMLLPFVLQVHATNVGWRYEQFFVQVDTEYGERHAHVSAPYHLLGPTWECDEVSIVEWGCAELHWEWVEQKLRLHVMDPEAHTSRVVVIRHAENAWKSSRANPPTPFKVQNTCGAWVFPMYMNTKSALNVLIATSAMKRLQRERAPHEYKKNGPARRRRRNMLYNCIQQDSLHALSGTFVVADETLKVPFRGVRSYEGMLQDWLLLLGNHNRKRMREEGIACSIYMVILKGNLGFMLNLDPVFNYVKLRLALLGGCSRNLSMVRLGETEVCEVVELQEINWNYPDWAHGNHEMVKEATSTSMEISRKGSVVLRLVFPSDTLWDEKAESDVLASCEMLYGALRLILAGGGSWPESYY